jgi:hypothetical protein
VNSSTDSCTWPSEAFAGDSRSVTLQLDGVTLDEKRAYMGELGTDIAVAGHDAFGGGDWRWVDVDGSVLGVHVLLFGPAHRAAETIPYAVHVAELALARIAPQDSHSAERGGLLRLHPGRR